MTPDLSTQVSLWPQEKSRRPVAKGMVSIRLLVVPPLAGGGPATIQLPERRRPLTLLLRWRSGGWLGLVHAPMNSETDAPEEQ